VISTYSLIFRGFVPGGGGGVEGVTPYNEEAPTERGTFLRLQVYEGA